MTTPRGKNADYWQGHREEADRQARRGRSPDVALLAQYVAQDMARDNGRKQKLFARSPGFYGAMDAQELGEASSTEMALKELKAMGYDPGEHDPLAILDAFHAGHKHARDQTHRIPGNELIGGNMQRGQQIGTAAVSTERAWSGREPDTASDASEGNFIARYIRGET